MTRILHQLVLVTKFKGGFLWLPMLFVSMGVVQDVLQPLEVGQAWTTDGLPSAPLLWCDAHAANWLHAASSRGIWRAIAVGCSGRIRVDRRITGNGKRFRVQAEGSRGAGVGMTKLSLSTKRELKYNVVARLNKRS